MDSHKLAFKLFLTDDSHVELEQFVPVFHRWIQTRALPGHQLIDVADYKHVPNGPGMVLVSHEANLHAERIDGRVGLLYFRKQPIPGDATFAARLRSVWDATVEAASLLQNDPAFEGRVRFRTDEALFRIYDRLHAPNEPGTFAKVKDDLTRFAQETFKAPDVTLNPGQPGESLFQVAIRSSKSLPLAELRSGASAEVLM